MDVMGTELLTVLRSYMGEIAARSLLDMSFQRAHVNIDRPRRGDGLRLIRELERGLHTYVRETRAENACLRSLSEALEQNELWVPETTRKVDVPIREEVDIVVARRAGRMLCQDLGFSDAMQIRIATAISELARNIVHYAGTGEIEIVDLETVPPGVQIIAQDQGPGITPEQLELILSGKYKSKRGFGMGIVGTRNIMDDFEIQTGPGRGTRVTVRAYSR